MSSRCRTRSSAPDQASTRRAPRSSTSSTTKNPRCERAMQARLHAWARGEVCAASSAKPCVASARRPRTRERGLEPGILPARTLPFGAGSPLRIRAASARELAASRRARRWRRTLRRCRPRTRLEWPHPVRLPRLMPPQPNRVFFPQACLDQWGVEGKIELTPTELVVLAEGRRYAITEVVRVVVEVTGPAGSSRAHRQGEVEGRAREHGRRDPRELDDHRRQRLRRRPRLGRHTRDVLRRPSHLCSTQARSKAQRPSGFWHELVFNNAIGRNINRIRNSQNCNRQEKIKFQINFFFGRLF